MVNLKMIFFRLQKKSWTTHFKYRSRDVKSFLTGKFIKSVGEENQVVKRLVGKNITWIKEKRYTIPSNY